MTFSPSDPIIWDLLAEAVDRNIYPNRSRAISSIILHALGDLRTVLERRGAAEPAKVATPIGHRG